MVIRTNQNILFKKSKMASSSFASNHNSIGNENLYKDLAVIIKELGDLTTSYLEGDVTTIVETLTPEYYADVSTKLLHMKRNINKYPDFEYIRLSFVRSLQSLQKIVIVSATSKTIQTESERYKEDSIILRDPVKLVEFLENMKNAFSLFGDTSMNVSISVAPETNPEYVEYFKLYGVPVDLVFDNDKLSEIKLRLKYNIS